MARRRFIQMREPPYDFFEVGEDYAPEPKAENTIVSDRHYDGLRATDGTDISTRTKHREYMKRHNLTTIDDYKETWAKAQAARDEYRTKGPRGIRQDVERAIEQLQKSR